MFSLESMTRKLLELNTLPCYDVILKLIILSIFLCGILRWKIAIVGASYNVTFVNGVAKRYSTTKWVFIQTGLKPKQE